MPDAPNYLYDEWRQGGPDTYPNLVKARAPINDLELWLWYPQYRPLLNKLYIAQLQGLKSAPHGIDPPQIDLCSRPIYNLEGLSVGARKVKSGEPLEYTAGYFWTEYLAGPQYSIELVYLNGTIEAAYCCVPIFKDHSIIQWKFLPEEELRAEIAYTDAFVKQFIDAAYSGCLTAELRSGKIIEIMPRLSSQFIDFYAEDDTYLDNVLEIYRHNRLKTPFKEPPGGVSDVLRVPNTDAWKEFVPKPDLSKIGKLEKQHGIRIYVPVMVDTALKYNADDPWSFRVAYINSKEGISEELKQQILDVVVF
jgi:hypothetical protein